MRFRVPVMFNAEVVYRGKRVPRSDSLAEWLDLEVTEADDAEAPVATAWKEYSRWEPQQRTPRCTRWYDGSHWEPVWERNDDYDPVALLTASRMAELLATGTRRGNPLQVGADWVLQQLASGTMEPFDPAVYRAIVTSDRDAVIAKAERSAADTLVVDGYVWKRCEEPVYILSRESVDRRPDGGRILYPKVIFLPEADHRNASDIFRADRFEDLVAEARERLGDTLVIDDDTRIEVYVPESIRYDDEWNALINGLRSEVERQRERLGRAKLGAVRAWLGLAEALEDALSERSADTEAALEKAADAYVSEIATEDAYFSERAAKVLARWQVRPIEQGMEEGLRP